MASDSVLRAVITVLDRTAEPMARINERFARLSAPLGVIRARLGNIAEEGGLNTIAERAKLAGEHVKRLGETLSGIVEPLAAIGAVGSLSGLAEIVKKTGEYGEKLYLTAQAAGFTTRQLGGLQYAASLVGTSSDQFFRGITYLNKNIASAALGQNKSVAGILYGMKIPNTPSAMAKTPQVLFALADEMKTLVGEGKVQTASLILSKTMGTRSGMQLLPLFEQGSAHLKEVMAEAAKHGQAMSAKQAYAAYQFNENLKQLSSSVTGLAYAIGNKLIPKLTPMLDVMTAWVDRNREIIASGIAGAVGAIGTALGSIDWRGLGSALGRIAAVGARVARVLGPFGVAGAILAIKLGPVARYFVLLGRDVAWAAAKFVLFPVAALVGQLATLIPTIGSLRDAWAALNIVMDANPLGVAVLAAATLAGAAYELYEHWRAVAGFFEGLWARLPGWFRGGVAAVGSAIVFLVRLPLRIYDNWAPISRFFEGLWAMLPGWFRAGIGAVGSAIVFLVRLPLTICDNWAPISRFFEGLWAMLPGWFRTGIGAVAEAVAFLVTLPLRIYENWAPISRFFEGLWAMLPGWFRGGVAAVGSAIGFLVRLSLTICDNWAPISRFFEGLWNRLPAPVKAAVAAIGALIAPFAAVPELIRGHWRPLADFFRRLWHDIAAIFRAAWNHLRPMIDGLRHAADWIGRIAGHVGHAVAAGATQVAHGAETVIHHAARRAGQFTQRLITGAGSPAANALLSGIASGEAKRYNELYGGGSFSGYAHFPQWAGKMVDGAMTHAAGLFQFEPATWKRMKNLLGLTDFSPASQREAALALAERVYRRAAHRDLLTDVEHHRLSARGIAALHSQWTSIGADFGNRVATAYRPLAATARAQGPAPQSHAKVTLDFRNVPHGTEPRVETKGEPDLAMNLGYALNY